MGPRPTEYAFPPKKVRLDQRVTEILPSYHKEITVDADNVGASSWEEMIRLTQTLTKDGLKEFGMVVSQKDGKFRSNKIITGHQRHIPNPIRWHGIIPELLKGKGVVAIHTHPMEKKDEHLATTIPSDPDIQAFISSGYAAFVILDQKGAHLLIRTQYFNQNQPPKDLVDGIYQDIKKRDGTTLDIQRILASKLEDYGISYYHTTTLSPNPDGTVAFKKPV